MFLEVSCDFGISRTPLVLLNGPFKQAKDVIGASIILHIYASGAVR
jgi:hypothetical protein